MRVSRMLFVLTVALLLIQETAPAQTNPARGPVATFSIVARDSATGELGVAVASRFFAVGSVVPWARAGVGAVATQSFANTSFGWRGLDLLERGASPQQALAILLQNDDDPTRRQVGIVAADGRSESFTGKNCLAWAGGRNGPNYAVQGNILTGDSVVLAMESTFLHSTGTLADKLYAALAAGDRRGGDSRGRQSAAMLIVKEGAGYGGYTDRAIDIRVDDHPDPFNELKRLLDYAQMNYAWNEGWTLFTRKQGAEAVPHLERAVRLDPDNPELLYDMGVIYLSAGRNGDALKAIQEAVRLNPKLRAQAAADTDLQALQGTPAFNELLKAK